MDKSSYIDYLRKIRRNALLVGIVTPVVMIIIFCICPPFNYLTPFIMFGALFYLGQCYKCPKCDTLIDLRTPPDQLNYCNNCGYHIAEHKKDV